MTAIFDAGPGALRRALDRKFRGPVTVPAFTTSEDAMSVFERARDVLGDPRPRLLRFIAREDVPVGRAFPLYRTDGDLVVYINRWWFDGLPCHRMFDAVDVIASPILPPGITGVPVVFE